MRPPFSQPPRRRLHALVRGAGMASAAVLLAGIAGLAACTGGEAAPGSAVAANVPAASVAAGTVAPVPVTSVVASPVTGHSDMPISAGADGGDALAAARTKLDTTLANALSCTADSECRSIAVGAKACGGPEGYRVYSSKAVAPAVVEALVQHERELAQADARASHRVSNCLMQADPGAHCEKSQCVSGGSNGGAATR